MGHPDRPQPIAHDLDQEGEAPVQDLYMLALYERHHLGTHPGVGQRRQEAIRLLPVSATIKDGAELMLGRRLDLESDIDQTILQDLSRLPSGSARGLYLYQIASREIPLI
jgi:hypothetical protein